MRALVATLLALTALSGCSDQKAEKHPNKLVSCSVAMPRDWPDAIAANEVKAGSANAVQVVAASDDGRTTIVKSWANDYGLSLHTTDEQSRPIITSDDEPHVVEFDGRKVKLAIQKPGHPATFHLWDAETGGPLVPIDLTYPGKDYNRSSDGTTTVWAEGHRLFAHRPDWSQQRLIAEVENSDQVGSISGPSVHGDFVSWWVSEGAVHVTDVRNGATVHLERGNRHEVVGGALTRFAKDFTSWAPLTALSPLPAC